MRKRFPNEPRSIPDCGVVEDWLVKQGWRSNRGGFMKSPKPLGKLPREEFEAMLYLIHEWDYAFDGVF